MKKDAYYFPHDSNAKDDPKCVMLIEQLGLEGYGIYWVLIETLRDQPDFAYPLNLLPAIARRFGTSSEKMQEVVNQYNLFIIEEEKFFKSPSLCRRMGDVNKNRINGIRGSLIKNNRITKEESTSLSDEEIIEIHQNSRGLLGGLKHPLCNKRKEKKIKENKEKKKNIGFEKFWVYWPNKKNKNKALEAWEKLTKEDVDELRENWLRWVDGYQHELALEEKLFTLHCSTFLNNRRWLDEFQIEKQKITRITI